MTTNKNGELKGTEDVSQAAILWGKLPGVTAVCPIIGHTGVRTSDGVIHDFVGSSSGRDDGVSRSRTQLAFGPSVKTIPLTSDDVDPDCFDNAVREINGKYANKSHNIIAQNCHHHVSARFSTTCLQRQSRG